MPEKKEFSPKGTVGMVSSVNTHSTALNVQDNLGGVKPIMSGGTDSPGGTKPMRAPEQKVMMPR